MKINLRHISTSTLLIVMSLFAGLAHALPPQAEADKLQIEAKSAMEAKNYAVAVEKFARMEKLKARFPATFAYHYGVALSKTGEFARAREQLDKYITKAGTNGKFYKEALETYAQTEANEKQAIKQAEIDKAYAKVMVKYEAELEQYNHDYEIYRTAKNKCDYEKSSEGRREGCEGWARGMNRYDPELVTMCMNSKNSSYPACENMPRRPTEPQKPKRE